MSKKHQLSCILLLALSVLCTAEKRPMTVDDTLDMIIPNGVWITPDGKKVLYSLSELAWGKNERKDKFYMIPSSGGQPSPYIGKEGGRSFAFSQDGKSLAFLRQIDEKYQIFIMPTDGGEACQLTQHKTDISEFKWAPNSKKIFFSAPKARGKEEEKQRKAGYDAFYVDEGPNGQNEDQWTELWQFDIQSEQETPLVQRDVIIEDYDISPDSSRIVYVARNSNRRNDINLNELYLVHLDTGEITALTSNNAPEAAPVWAPDGKAIAYLAPDEKEWLNRDPKIFLLDPENKGIICLSGLYQGNIFSFVWAPDSSSILFNGQQGTRTNLFTIEIPTGKFHSLSQFQGTIQAAAFSADRSRIAYIYSESGIPPDVYISDTENFNPSRLTEINPWIMKDILLSKTEIIRWPSIGGFTIEGILHLPASYKEGGRLPLILQIHGGPAGSFTNRFFPEFHVYTGLGYAFLCPNVRGSSGYSDHLREGNTFQKGDGIGLGDYQDLMHGVDYLIDKGLVDGDRMGLRGWSYGGILGGWTLTRTDRFKAASLGAGVYDWTSEYGPGFNYDVRLWHIGGTPWDNPEGYRSRSTLTYVDNIITPTLIIHGMEDPTDTEAQSMMLFTALKDIGKVPVRYLRVPREKHVFREPRHLRTRRIEDIKWMHKHILGIEWKPEDRKDPIESGAQE